jgi:separase
VKLLRRAWSSIEERQPQLTSSNLRPQTGTEKLAEDSSQLNLSTTAILGTDNHHLHVGSEFWAIITPLFRGLSHLSQVYAHHGMFQETMYYAEQALKLVEKVGSKTQAAAASAYVGSIWLKAGDLEKGAEYLKAAKELGSSGEHNRATVLLDYYIGSMQGRLGDRKAELEAYDKVEASLQSLTKKDFIDMVDQIVDSTEALEEKMSRLDISKSKTPARKKAARPKAVSSRKVASRVTPPVDIVLPVGQECTELMSLKAMVLRHKAQALMCTKGFTDALNLLQESEAYSKSNTDAVNYGLAMAKRLLLHSIDQMNSDPLYSVLQESTISFPAVVAHSKADKSSTERSSSMRLSPPGKGKIGKCSPSDSFIDKLYRAQEYLLEVHSVALSTASVASVHSISSVSNSVSMLLSAAAEGKGNSLTSPGFASSLIGV